jgi:hypothetical protein
MINTTLFLQNPALHTTTLHTTTSNEIDPNKYIGFQIIVNLFAVLALCLIITIYCYRHKISSRGCLSKCMVIMSVLGGILFLTLFNSAIINAYISIQEGYSTGYTTVGIIFIVAPLILFLGGGVTLLVDFLIRFINQYKEKKRIFRVLPTSRINT